MSGRMQALVGAVAIVGGFAICLVGTYLGWLFSSVVHAVPFACQAPLGEWSDPRQQDGCEEVCLVMAVCWVQGENLTPEIAKEKILELSEYEKGLFGFFQDTGVGDTFKLIESYCPGINCWISEELSVFELKRFLAEGCVVMVPINGALVALESRFEHGLGKRKYNLQDLDRHMVLLVGYINKEEKFVVHDPGTRHGAYHEFDFDDFVASICDYPSRGAEDKQPIERVERRAIVISR